MFPEPADGRRVTSHVRVLHVPTETPSIATVLMELGQGVSETRRMNKASSAHVISISAGTSLQDERFQPSHSYMYQLSLHSLRLSYVTEISATYLQTFCQCLEHNPTACCQLPSLSIRSILSVAISISGYHRIITPLRIYPINPTSPTVCQKTTRCVDNTAKNLSSQFIHLRAQRGEGVSSPCQLCRGRNLLLLSVASASFWPRSNHPAKMTTPLTSIYPTTTRTPPSRAKRGDGRIHRSSPLI